MNWEEIIRTQWLDIGISTLIFLFTVFLGRWLIKIFFSRIIRRFTSATKTTFDDVLMDTVTPPLYWLVVVYALQFFLKRLEFIVEQFSFELEPLFFVLFWLISFSVSGRLVTNIAKWYEDQLSATDEVELAEQLLPFLRRLLLIILVVIFIIIFLDYFDIEVGGMVATLGIGSLAIALAAKETLSDTISGFVIMMDRPYRIGDRIEVQDLNTWGDVVDIGLRSTRIRTRDNRMVIIPNSVIAKSLIVNHSYPDTQYRIQIHIGVAYGSDVEQTRQVMTDAVRQVEGVLPNRPVEALFLEFGDSALIFRVRWWLESYVDTRRMFDKVNTAIYKGLNEASITIPFPQRVITYKMDPAENAGSIEVFPKKK